MNDSEIVLETKGLHKEYGRITAVNELDLQIERGSVFGLLGPNGSGKTTTLGMVLDIIRPSKGHYKWFGKEPTHHQRKRVGAILEKPNFYPKLSAEKNLELICKIKGVEKNRISEVLEQVGLKARSKDNFSTYSLGMKQRLAIGSALLAHPEVLILDEPTNGLDPEGIAEIRSLIIDIAQSGKTILLASHLLDEVQKVCNEFAILRKGSLIHHGRVDTGFGDDVIIELGSLDLVSLRAALDGFSPYVSSRLLKDRIEAKFVKDTDPTQVTEYLSGKQIYLSHLRVMTKDLEQQFMEILAEHEQ
ncbi:MAG: ATP-binding cassette domain-containing protein [Flavobacteriales bacterium]|nr:ATP-binding cassette domain-containing protein [Flavobacteriales bacterium]NNK81353.1 ATP-binding cassette domain-containing protein [Flavobacteriales bacterium]